jgi:glucokinase
MSDSSPSIFFPAAMAPVACVDIGGTKVAVSVADAQGVRGKVTEPTATVGDRGALAAAGPGGH